VTTAWLGAGISLAAFALSTLLVARSQHRTALAAVARSAEPYDLSELPEPAHQAGRQIVTRWVRHGAWAYTRTTFRIAVLLTGTTAAIAGALTFLESSWDQSFGAMRLLSRTPYTLAASCLISLGYVWYVLSREPSARAELSARGRGRWLLSFTAAAFREPACAEHFAVVSTSAQDAAHTSEQLEYDHVASAALNALPYVRELPEQEFRHAIDNHLVFAARLNADPTPGDVPAAGRGPADDDLAGAGSQAQSYAQLSRHFDGLFNRMQQDAEHEDLWRVGILRSLVWYAGAAALVDLTIGDPPAASVRTPPRVVEPDAADLDDSHGSDGLDSSDGSDADQRGGGRVLETALGTAAAGPGLETASGVAMVLDLTQTTAVPDPSQHEDGARTHDDDVRH
jgi:hypothetical protein